MKVLVACEESQRVCMAFRERGHEAYSCDIIECSGGHPEWHIMQDVLSLLNGKCEFVTEDGKSHNIGDYIPKHFPHLAEKYNLPIKPTQIIHPWMFGDNYSKSTCLWLKGIEPLVPIVTEQPELEWFEWIDSKTGKKKRQPKWFADAWHLPAEERAKVRSKTFPGIAKAMAEQWG